MERLTQRARRVLSLAHHEAERLRHNYIGTEHLLLGLVRYGEGIALNVLRKLGVSPEQIRRQTRRVLQESSAPRRGAAASERRSTRRESRSAKTPMIDQLAVDLTSLAEEEKLDPVIGRETEIERVIQILARRNKNNPALIGEPGVGKTAT